MAYSQSPRESGEESEDEEMIEESPCGRWSKRNEEVDQRDVPGIAGAYLAMDNEEGVEVVWNELLFPDMNHFKREEIKYRELFDCLAQLEHPNIMTFHRYWSDTYNDKPRIVFITEYMSSGSWKQFLKKTKRNVKKLSLHAWKRWCTQILSALGYLHASTPPIVHANLTCDTIFIQHNGLVKIGSVSPESVHYHVISTPEYKQHSQAYHKPEPQYRSPPTTAKDIFAFGLCALEMAAVDVHNDDDAGNLVRLEKHIQQTIAALEDPNQRDFLQKCLHEDPAKRGTVRELLHHPLLFEVPSLKLLAAHSILNSSPIFSDTIIDERMQTLYKTDSILAYIQRADHPIEVKLRDVPTAEKLVKFIEDVKYGIYPLTAYESKRIANVRIRALSPDAAESVKSATPEPVDIETREVVNMMCSVKPRDGTSGDLLMTLLLRMDDKMNRQLTCQVSVDDSPIVLTHELVHLGFIHENDREKIIALIDETLRTFQNNPQQLQPQHESQPLQSPIQQMPQSLQQLSQPIQLQPQTNYQNKMH